MEPSYSPGKTHVPGAWPARVQALLRSARARHVVLSDASVADGATAADRAAAADRVSAADPWGGDAVFTVLRRGERNTVLRATLPGPLGETRSVVLKLFGDDSALADADWRCMQALSGSGVVPDVIAGLADARGFAMVDLGDETFERVLARGTSSDALQVVTRMAEAYARLHVEGRSLVARTEAMRSSALTYELGDWTDGLPRALAWLHLTDDDSRVRRALSRVVHAWYAARDAVTLTQGDPAPGNVLLASDGAVRLVDFEYGAARHPAYDLAAWDVICPLPGEAVRVFRASYASRRQALGWPMDSAEDDASYAAVFTHRALALLSWLPPAARTRDVPWVESWTARQAVLSTLDRLATRARHDSELQRLAEAAERAASQWREAWPDVERVLPPWPAFRGAIA